MGVTELWGVRVSPRGEPAVFGSFAAARMRALTLASRGVIPTVLERSAVGAPWRVMAESTWLAG